MASGWHKKLARLFQADWNEIRTRGGQELHKRSDLLRYRLGRNLGSVPLSMDAPSAATTAHFFFAPAEASARAELLREHLPDQAEAIVHEADEICRHRFRLLGYEDLDYGTEIDWHLDRVHNQRAPLDPWFKIPFLDFAAVGDHKVTWELNRHQHLVTLAKAWLLTKDEKYVRELIAQWRSWQKANPYPLGIHWGSTLEVAFRSLSWIWVDHLLAAAPGYAEFRAELLPALAFQGRYIERYLSTYFSPNTHLLGEALAMFFIGTLYPQMPHASRWRDKGWKILLQEAGRQVRPDGVYFEQSLYYHVYALDFFLHARHLASKNAVEITTGYDEVVQRMLKVVETLAQAGPAEGFGDDDGGRLFNPRRNRTEHMTDPLSLGAVLYDGCFAAAPLTEESIWLFGERAVQIKASADEGVPAAHGSREPLGSTAFADGGLYVLTSSEPFPQAMMIDAGPFGTGRCGHGHADALSVRLTMNGARWLVDSGSGVYISADPAERNAFRSTAAHNTLRVDGTDQAIADEPFSWTEIPTTRVESWVAGRTFAYFSGNHNGYERLTNPVTHRRSVLRVEGGIWLLRDIAMGTGEHNAELNWHFATGLDIGQIAPSEFQAFRPENKDSSLHLIFPQGGSWTKRLIQGRISPAYGRLEAAPLLQCACRAELPTEFATAMIVAEHSDKTRKESLAAMTCTAQPAVQVWELHRGSDDFTFFFARDKQPWSTGLWSSDAEVLFCRSKNERLEHLVAIGGSSVAWQGSSLLNASEPFQFFEWRRRDGLVNSAREKFSTTPAFEDLISGLHSPSSPSHPTTYAEKH